MDCAPADIRNGHCFGTWGRIEQHKDLGKRKRQINLSNKFLHNEVSFPSCAQCPFSLHVSVYGSGGICGMVQYLQDLHVRAAACHSWICVCVGVDWHCPIETREPQRRSAVFQSPHLKRNKQVRLILSLTQYTRNMIVSTCNQYKSM